MLSSPKKNPLPATLITGFEIYVAKSLTPSSGRASISLPNYSANYNNGCKILSHIYAKLHII
jgi:hypothetical protein